MAAPETFNIGALIIRIGFGAHYIIVMVRNPQNSIGKYLGPYIMQFRVEGFGICHGSPQKLQYP